MEDIYFKSVFKTLQILQLRIVKLLNGTDKQEINSNEFDNSLRSLLVKM